MTTNDRKAKLEQTLTTIAQKDVEITVRGLRDFTFSFEGRSDSAMESIKKYFSGHAKTISSEYDLECDFSAIYVTL